MQATLNTYLQVDRERAKNTFAEYVEQYNATDEKIKLKIDHTYRVADLCEKIALSIGLNENAVNLAWMAGLLHDVGRFEQIRNFGTFSDADSVDHAKYGADILFCPDSQACREYSAAFGKNENGKKIREYMLDDSEDVRLEQAIRCHSAFRIPQEYDADTRLLSEILRDADKIDILRVNVDTPMEEIYNVTTEELYQAEVTDAVMESFFEEHATLRSIKRSPIDHLVGHISLVYELVFPISRKLVEEQGYLDILLGFQSKNPRTREQFAVLNKKMREFLAR